MNKFSIILIPFVLVPLTVGVYGNCIIDSKTHKNGAHYKVGIALNWNKRTDPTFDKSKMSPGYVLYVVHDSSFTLFNLSVPVIPQVKLLIEENVFVSSKLQHTLLETIRY